MNERDELRANAYVDGELSQIERAAFEAELAHNAELRSFVAELRIIDAKLRSASEGERRASEAVVVDTIRSLERRNVETPANTLRWAAALISAGLLGFLIAEFHCVRTGENRNPPTIPAPGPSIESVIGEVFISRADMKGADPVARGAPWQVGDMLSTSTGASALVAIPRVVEIALGPDGILSRIDDIHFEFSYGHAIIARAANAPTISIRVPGVDAEILIEEGGCELDLASPMLTKKQGPGLLRVRAIAGPSGSSMVRIGDRELRNGASVLVGDGFFRESEAPDSRELKWYVDLWMSRDR